MKIDNQNFFRNALRNLKKQSGYALINIGGLAIGLTSFLLISLYVVHELSYDRFHKNHDNIYRVRIVGRMAGGVIDQAITAAPMASAILSDYPEVESATRLLYRGEWLVINGENRFYEEGLLFADSTFFKVFGFRLLKGDPNTALVRPRSIILTEEFAVKYFGEADPLGQRMSLESDTNLYTVTGVVQNIPDNSHLQFDMLGSISSFPGQANSQVWIDHSFHTYIVVTDGASRDLLQEKLQDVIIKYVGPQLQEFLGLTLDDFRKAGNEFSYVLDPLKDLHMKGATQFELEQGGSLTTVYIFAAIALLILIVAIINYVNLATAKSAGRAKEVGIKKVSGASNAGLISQFLGESILVVAFSAIIAVVLVISLTPAFNHLTGKEMAFGLFDSLQSILLIVLLVLFVGVSAGFYPAFVLASFNPVNVLKGTLNPGSVSKKLRGMLVVIQFTVSIVIIIGTIVVHNQLNYMTEDDPGFKKENLIVIPRAYTFFEQRESFREQLMQLPGVENVGFSRALPGNTFNNNGFLKDDDPEKNTYLLNQTDVSYDFAQTLGVELSEGRFFSREYGSDSTAVLINQAAVKYLGLTDPVGKYLLQLQGPQQFQRLQIIGIMKDFNIESMHKEIPPVCFTVLENQGGRQFAAVRITGADLPGTIRAIEEKWHDYTVGQTMQYDFFVNNWNNLYATEMKTGKIFILFSFLGIFIACLGLLGLVTFITNRRTREIGIRKTYGASVPVILRLLSKEVLSLILISSLIAFPVAYFGTKYWLKGFADKITVSPMVYLLAAGIALIIGWIAISYQTVKAANYNPADALRID